MARGIWVVLIIPAIVALIFGAWVLYSIMIDVSQRDLSLSLLAGIYDQDAGSTIASKSNLYF